LFFLVFAINIEDVETRDNSTASLSQCQDGQRT